MAELVLWPLQILSWSMRPDQTVPISSSLNLAFPSLRGTQGFSGGICSFEEKCCIPCFAPRPWLAGSFLTGGTKSPLKKPALGCQRRSHFDGGGVLPCPPIPHPVSLCCRWSQAHHFPATLAGLRCVNWVQVTSQGTHSDHHHSRLNHCPSPCLTLSCP